MIRDAFIITLKDLHNHQGYLSCIILAVAVVLLSFVSAAASIKSILMPNSICWLVFPLLLGSIIAITAGDRIVADETNTNMLEVLLAMGVSPFSFVLGKAFKPILCGIAISIIAYLAAQIGFAVYGDSTYILYGFGIPFILVALTSIISTTFFLTAFSIVLRNASIYAAASFCIASGPTVLLCNNYSVFSFSSPVEILPLVLIINCVLCVIGFIYALWLLRYGSPHRMTSS